MKDLTKHNTPDFYYTYRSILDPFFVSQRYVPTLIFYERMDGTNADSLAELDRQVEALQEQSSCTAM